MKQQEIPGVGIINIPDGASPEAIESAIATAKANYSPINSSQVLGREPLDASPANVYKDSPIGTFISSLARAFPGSDMLGGAMQAGQQKLSGNQKPFGDLYDTGKEKFKSESENLRKENPGSALLGTLAGTLPQYMGGEKAIGEMGLGLLGKMFAGAGLNSAITKGTGEKVTALDPILGAAGPLAGAAGTAVKNSEMFGSIPKKIVDGVIRPYMSSLPMREKVDLAKEILMRGLKGSPEMIREWGTAALDTIGKAKNEMLAPFAGKQIKKSFVSDEVAPLIDELGKEPALAGMKDKITQFLKEFYQGPKMTVGEADPLKTMLQGKAQKGYEAIAKGGDISSEMMDYFMKKASGLRQAIENEVPQVAGINKDYGIISNIRDIFAKMEKAGMKKSPTAVSWKDMGAAIPGVVMGGPKGGAAAVAGQRMLGSPKNQLAIAQMLNKLIQSSPEIGGMIGKLFPQIASQLGATASEQLQ